MIFIEKYKALVIKELPKNGILIYVVIGYDSFGKLELHYTKQPLLHPDDTTMESLLEPYKQDADAAFIKKYCEMLKVIKVYIMIDQED